MQYTRQMLLEGIQESIEEYLVANHICSHEQAKDESFVLRQSLTLQLNTLESLCKLQRLTTHKHQWENAGDSEHDVMYCKFCEIEKSIDRTESLPF